MNASVCHARCSRELARPFHGVTTTISAKESFAQEDDKMISVLSILAMLPRRVNRPGGANLDSWGEKL